tara:strand:+ start:1152 stop:1892 length:741 start_codon:yes stop_codon:yes gene_type:complete
MPGGYGTSGPWGSSGDSYTGGSSSGGGSGSGSGSGSGGGSGGGNQGSNYNPYKELADSLKAAGAVTSGALSGTALWQQQGLPSNVYHSTFQQGSQAHSPTGYVYIDPNLNPGVPKMELDEDGNIVWSQAAHTWDPHNQRWVRSTYTPWNPHATGPHHGGGGGSSNPNYGPHTYGGDYYSGIGGAHPLAFHRGRGQGYDLGTTMLDPTTQGVATSQIASNMLRDLSEGVKAFSLDPKTAGILAILDA